MREKQIEQLVVYIRNCGVNVSGMVPTIECSKLFLSIRTGYFEIVVHFEYIIIVAELNIVLRPISSFMAMYRWMMIMMMR